MMSKEKIDEIMKKATFLSFLILTLGLLLGTSDTVEAQRRERVHRRHHRHAVRVHVRVTRRAHIRYAHHPRWGAVVVAAPRNAVVIRDAATPYYFNDGIYYVQRNTGFVVVRPAPGIRIRVLPVGYRTVVVRSHRPYYYYYGTFYTKVNNSDEYEVTAAPEGAIVNALPDGYEVKTIKDQEYYVLDDVYYAEVEAEDMEDGVGYQVVRI